MTAGSRTERIRSRLIAAAVALIAPLGAASCAERMLVPGEPRVAEHVVIAPYAMREECARLAAGDRLDYRYQSSEPLAFNIHYRENGAVLAPLVRERSTGDSGIFEAPLPRDYCATWEAGAAGAIIAYRLLVRGATTRP